MTSFYDVTMILMLLGREVYKESEHKPWGCCLGFHNWMVGSIPKKSLTLYFGYTVPLMEQEYILDELCVLFIYLHVPDFLGNPLVSMTLVVWQLVG